MLFGILNGVKNFFIKCLISYCFWDILLVCILKVLSIVDFRNVYLSGYLYDIIQMICGPKLSTKSCEISLVVFQIILFYGFIIQRAWMAKRPPMKKMQFMVKRVHCHVSLHNKGFDEGDKALLFTLNSKTWHNTLFLSWTVF